MFHELHVAATQSGTFHPAQPSMTYRCARFLSPTKVLCAINDRTTKRSYFGVYVLNLDKGWRDSSPKRLPSRIRGVTSMDVSSARRMIAISTSDMSIIVFHVDTFAVRQLYGY